MAAQNPFHVSAKLTHEYDSDLIEEIEKIPKRDRSRTYREALRFYFRHRNKINLPDSLLD